MTSKVEEMVGNWEEGSRKRGRVKYEEIGEVKGVSEKRKERCTGRKKYQGMI